ncbi:MAG TPA: protochlorophyllide reductase [Polyangiaceae bacterium LLY-WYZ-14_1]|nr:protochlorophyllide reductase [Polyangiaceae bacterium LLY-WYZ-14_1]
MTELENDGREGPPTVVITGTTSGIELHTARALGQQGWRVVGACRDVDRGVAALERVGVPRDRSLVLPIDLGSLQSVRRFTADYQDRGLPLDALVLNAAVYMPTLAEPRRSPEGFELSVATNHFGHFVLATSLLPTLARSRRGPRLITLGTVTANSEELGGKIPIPAPADLGDLAGLRRGFRAPESMIDGKRFKPGKAYKDSKLCNMIISRELHRRYHQETGIVFNSLYPGCVADTALFRHAPEVFRRVFPWFQKKITGGYVSMETAGERVADLVTDARFDASGQHWSWGNRQRAGRGAFPQPLSPRARDPRLAEDLWRLTAELCEVDTPAVGRPAAA